MTETTERPNPEVPPKAKRRRFTAAYKLRILREADQLKRDGISIGGLLRREALYSSHLSDWRRARERGALGALAQKRGRKPSADTAVKAEMEKLRRQNARLQRELDKAMTIIDVQKKLSQILGIQPHDEQN